MVLMRTRLRFSALTLAAATAVVGCAGSSSEPIAAPADTADVIVVDEALVPPTIEPGSMIPVGELDSVRQQVSTECADALEPIRALYSEYASGLEMQDKDLGVFNSALAAGFAECDADEWADFQELELKGWMNAAPNS